MEQPAIACKGVTFRYLEKSRPILEDVSFSLPAGSISVLMGSSGCGKSTLASVLCGLLPENGGFLSSGEITLFGKPLKSFSPRERTKEISMMFQNPDLQFCMKTLRKELYFCMENICIPREEMERRAENAAKAIGIERLLDRPLHTLSGGEKQRAVLACIYLLDAKCILLDEPFANLDPDSVQELMTLLHRLCREQGKTIVAIDHMADHWIGTADRFLLLGPGARVLCQTESLEQFEQVKTLFREQGVAYPGIWQETELPHGNANRTGSSIVLHGLTMPEVPQKPKKRRKPAACVAQDQSLLFEGNAVFPAGQITAILGPSGSGKTSLLMTLLGQRDYLGDIEIQNGDIHKDMRDMHPAERFSAVGMAFQNPENQFVTQNVTAEIMDGLQRRYADETPDTLRTRAIALLDSCGLKKYQEFSPYMLSQGQQRRLAVLAVLAGGQKVLLLDEPTYGQDYRSARALMDQVREQVQAVGLTVLMTTHDRGLAETYADVRYRLEGHRLTREVDTL
ncbi:MAG: ATP-binding cassette domain-containing protein [Eubacteriales bacterium]|nr:ATP-binding cassette domain-containing protein [Eubacteriales bacterium]